eukprot:snap_masked-scaffold_44-processed-gene-1.35-mRNA-1 protein AED:1.00 eAED:1.00 QI:0/0/0/0/1/1/5/0/77
MKVELRILDPATIAKDPFLLDCLPNQLLSSTLSVALLSESLLFTRYIYYFTTVIGRLPRPKKLGKEEAKFNLLFDFI